MGLIELLVFLIIIGIILWLLNSYIPMDPKIKTIINVVIVIVAIVLALIILFGVFNSGTGIRINK